MTKTLKKRDFVFKTEPYEHQLTAFEQSRDAENFALFMEMGTGKTKVALDTAAWLYDHGKIDGLVVIAPNGVHRNWVHLEVPIHLPERTDYVSLIWTAGKQKTKTFQRAWKTLIENKGLSIFAINVEALSSATGAQVVHQFLKHRRSLMVVDESTRIKSPKAKRTKTAIRLGQMAHYRRILTGTPVTQSPFDLFAQFRFLDSHILGYTSYYVFKHYFGVWQVKHNAAHGRKYEDLQSYANLDELKELVAPHSYRITKEECLDLPPKVFQRWPVQLSKEQRKLYDTMASDMVIEFENEIIAAPIVLTKLLRLRQITGGFLPPEQGDERRGRDIPGGNPKLEALVDIINELPTVDGKKRVAKVIVWAVFRPELAAIADALRALYGRETVVEYHGGIKNDEREEAKISFQDEASPVRFFIGNPQSAGLGLTLTAATVVVYYSNDFSLEQRLQSEDRNHRIGTKHAVTYIDLEAEDTIDEDIVTALQDKIDLANYMNGDELRKLVTGNLFGKRKKT